MNEMEREDFWERVYWAVGILNLIGYVICGYIYIYGG